MLRTHGRVASCQPAAALSVSCLVAVCLSFTHSTHSFACPISPRLFRLSVSPLRPLFLSLFFFNLSLSLSFFRDWRSNSLAPLQRRTCAHLPAKIFFRSGVRADDTHRDARRNSCQMYLLRVTFTRRKSLLSGRYRYSLRRVEMYERANACAEQTLQFIRTVSGSRFKTNLKSSLLA